MRLIDADALMKWVNDHYDFEVYTVGYISDIIKDIPTVDAEPVIRCKDCKYWYAGENINYCRKFWDDDGEPKLYRCTADDFCSRAERKEE